MADFVSSPFAIWALLLAVAGSALWLGIHTRWGRHMSGVAITIFAGVALGNFGVLPQQHGVYDSIFTTLLPVALALLLLQAHLATIFREAAPLLLAFAAAIVATLGGVLLAWLIVPLGADGPPLAAMLTASYIGGSANFFAVAETAGFTEAAVIPAAVAADTLATNLYIIAAMLLPGFGWAVRLWPSSRVNDPAPAPKAERPAFNPPALALALALAFALVAGAEALAGALGTPRLMILILTALALTAANIWPRQMARLEGSQPLGLMLLFLFLTALGAGADVRAVLASSLNVAAFVLLILGFHLIILLALGRLLRLGLPELLIASNAAVGGTSSAGPIAAARGWHSLVTPGILVGALGNAVGTFIGAGVYGLLS